jgi:predicted RNase H-like HicB family nuclease
MLTKYLHAAMAQAEYEILPDGIYYGHIPEFQGVWATAENLEACRNELQEVLEGWLVLGLRLGHEIPAVEGISLKVDIEAA